MVETNYEHYKDELLAYALTTGECEFIQEKILKKDCIGIVRCKQCKEKVLNWLKQPYKEPVIEIDWSKVPVNTPVYVSDGNSKPDETNFRRHFKKYDPDAECKFVTFNDGNSSFTDKYTVGTHWNYCSLARLEDVEKYKKR